jgi:hypothetical protein
MRDSNCQVSGSRLRNLVEKFTVLVSTSIFILLLLSRRSRPIFQKAVISIILTIESSVPSILFLFWDKMLFAAFLLSFPSSLILFEHSYLISSYLSNARLCLGKTEKCYKRKKFWFAHVFNSFCSFFGWLLHGE